MDTGLLSAGEAPVEIEPPIRLVARASAGVVILRATYIVCLSLVGLFCLSEVSSARTSLATATALVVGLFSFGILAFWAWVAYVLRRTPGEVTDDEVRLYVGLRRRERVIPLDSIAAVGMVYEILRRPTGWISYLWLEDGEAVPLGLAVWMANRSDVDDWEKLAATPPGNLCIKLLDRARARQGESGAVARDRITDRRGLGTPRAYWPADRSLATPAS
jgi:hypothetical protein